MSRGRSYSDYVRRGEAQYGAEFSTKNLTPKFIPYYNSGDRIKVRTPYGEEITGTVGATTGWLPCFLLMRTTRSMGSSICLNDDYHIVGVKRGRKYLNLAA